MKKISFLIFLLGSVLLLMLTSSCNKENTCNCKTLTYGSENVPENEKTYITSTQTTKDDCSTLNKMDTIVGIPINRTVCTKK